MFAAAFLSLILGVCDLGAEFARPEAWKVPAERFVAAYRSEGFKAADRSLKVVNCLRAGASAWKSFPLWESRVYYGADGVTRVEMSLYNRGDAAGTPGELTSMAALDELLARVVRAIGAEGKPPAVERRKNRSGGVQCVQRWADVFPAVELAWGSSKGEDGADRPDFVRVVLTQKGETRPKGVVKSVAGNIAKAKVRANVITDSSTGDVFIDNVPMVDQGQKGYCAAAVSERVLRYYGHPIDEHQFAQLAGTSAEGGTQVNEMIESVKAVASKCRLGFVQIVAMTGSMKDIRKEIENYNKAAKALKHPPIAYDAFLQGDTFMVREMRQAMAPEVVLAQRKKDSRFKRFLTGVKTQIDQGIPVFWGVTLGMFPEPGVPQSGGGHMRLIIGYNAKTHEIIYTDTWGAGHECKRMAEDRAFAITHTAFFLKPL
ncbi:MAG: C39 family peptidase [Kiritimatiellia bacterium]